MTLFVYPPITISTSGLATEAKQDDIIGYIDTIETLLGVLNAKDFATQTTLATRATEATAQKLREWPYADYDWIGDVWNAGTFTETFTYKTGGAGGASVGTAIIVYTDATRAQPATVAYSPAKVV
jgi:hypothetical protein